MDDIQQQVNEEEIATFYNVFKIKCDTSFFHQESTVPAVFLTNNVFRYS